MSNYVSLFCFFVVVKPLFIVVPWGQITKKSLTILWLTNSLSQIYDKVTIVPNYKRIL